MYIHMVGGEGEPVKSEYVWPLLNLSSPRLSIHKCISAEDFENKVYGEEAWLPFILNLIYGQV